MSLNQRSAASDTTLAVAKASTAFLSLSLVIFAYERALSPSYGSGPTSFLLLEFIRGVALLCALNPFTISAGRNLLYSALLLILAPNASYWVPVLTSRRNDPFWGPAFTHLVVLSPLVFFLTNSVLEVRVGVRLVRCFLKMFILRAEECSFEGNKQTRVLLVVVILHTAW